MSKAVFIGINKGKMRRQAIVLGLLAVVLGISLFAIADQQEFIYPLIIKMFGGAITAILILSGAAKAKKMKDKNAGLLLDSDGIHDSSSDISIGFVKWKDIKDINADASSKFGFLLIQVKNPDAYIKNAKNKAIARLLTQNMRLYKTPVAIDSSNLDCSLSELIEKVNTYSK